MEVDEEADVEDRTDAELGLLSNFGKFLRDLEIRRGSTIGNFVDGMISKGRKRRSEDSKTFR